MKSKFFSVKELVCKHVYDRYGEAAAMFLDDKLIETINTVREKITGTWAAASPSGDCAATSVPW